MLDNNIDMSVRRMNLLLQQRIFPTARNILIFASFCNTAVDFDFFDDFVLENRETSADTSINNSTIVLIERTRKLVITSGQAKGMIRMLNLKKSGGIQISKKRNKCFSGKQKNENYT